MQIGELVAIGSMAPHTTEGCPFCRPKEHTTHENQLTPDDDEDADPEADNDLKNSSGTLAKNLGSRPQATEVPSIPKGENAPVLTMKLASAQERTWHDRVYQAGSVPVLYGAHHLIPGNDALRKSNLYTNRHLGPVDDGSDPLNVGYNVNSANNGCWLPGNYAVRPWKGIDPEFQKAYAFLAMSDSLRQFHDAHKPFSEFIRSELNDLDIALDQMEHGGCPACGKGKQEHEPMYHINSRLNAISRHVAGYLHGDPGGWKVPAFTSGWAPLYKDFVNQKGGADGAKAALEAMRNAG